MNQSEDRTGKRAGAVVYRLDEGRIRYLLVTLRSNLDPWILPQGHQILGETLEQTACRETREESGCEVEIEHKLGSLSVFSGGRELPTYIFLARLISTGTSPEGRGLTWRTIEGVENLEVLSETRQLLKTAQSLIDNRIRKAEQVARSLLGTMVTVVVDRPIGTKHAGLCYPTNYGFVEGIIGKDGELLDAYVLGVDKPVKTFTGKCIAMIQRTDDFDDKLIIVPQGVLMDTERIREETHFVEGFFESDIIY